MSKLLELKKYLTIAEAARCLSSALGEEVSEGSIYQFILDGQIAPALYSTVSIIVEHEEGGSMLIAMGAYDLTGEFSGFIHHLYRLITTGIDLIQCVPWKLSLTDGERTFVANYTNDPDASLNNCNSTVSMQIVTRAAEIKRFLATADPLKNESCIGGGPQAREVSKKRRPDTLSVEIDEIIRSGIPPHTEDVRRALIARCGKPGTCMTFDEEMTPHYKGASGIEKPLTTKALKGRLQRRKKRLRPD